MQHRETVNVSVESMRLEPINIISTDTIATALLSNFADTPFVLDGVVCASIEGFCRG